MRSSLSRFCGLIGVAAWLCAPGVGAVPQTVAIAGGRVELGEILPNAPESMRAIDICAAPKVGTSRLLERQVIERQVQAAGFDTSGLTLPPSVRIERTGHKYTPAELGAMLEKPVSQALPAGVSLLQVEATVALTLEEGALPGPITLPKLPDRIGSVRIAFSVEFMGNDTPIRVPVTAIVQIAEHAARAAMARGSRVQLAITRGSARITADATALADGNIGEELRFRVNSTGKVLRGIVVSPTLAKVSD